jgi:hypothetical protein
MTRRFIALLVLGLFSCAAPGTDVTGVWSGQVTDPGGEAIDLVLNLSATGTALSGTAAAAPDDSAFTIENGRIEGAHLSFEISRRSPESGPDTFSVTAAIAGDRMTGSIVDRREGVTLPFTLTRNRSGRAAARRDNGPGRSVSRAPAGAEPPAPKGSEPSPEDARKAVLAAFADHEVVGMGILSYANQDFDDFILALIRDPAFPKTVNDIVVECGNSLYQPVLDRYIAGQEVPLSEARNVWRNTTQPMCGLSAFYEQLFPLVRQINQTLPAGKRLRVLAGDPPIDWGRVRTADDTRPFRERDTNIASVVEHEVLARHRKALMIFGIRHLMHGGGGAVGMYERKLETAGGPHLTYVIMAHNGFGNRSPLTRYNDELERRLASWPVPSLAALPGTWLADLDYGYFFAGEGGGGRKIATRVDGYLYLGPRALLLNEPLSAAALDTVYLRELVRRAAINGRPVTQAGFLQGALDSTVFFNQHAAEVAEPSGR